MLTAKAKYAVRAMQYVAQNATDAPIVIGVIAEACAIPRRFSETILTELVRADLLRSARGRQGGYRLSRQAEEISWADVLEAVEGPFVWADCAADNGAPCAECPDGPACDIRALMRDIYQDNLAKLRRIRINDRIAPQAA